MTTRGTHPSGGASSASPIAFDGETITSRPCCIRERANCARFDGKPRAWVGGESRSESERRRTRRGGAGSSLVDGKKAFRRGAYLPLWIEGICQLMCVACDDITQAWIDSGSAATGDSFRHETLHMLVTRCGARSSRTRTVSMLIERLGRSAVRKYIRITCT